jgi:hypothetical protein
MSVTHKPGNIGALFSQIETQIGRVQKDVCPGIGLRMSDTWTFCWSNHSQIFAKIAFHEVG